MLNVGRGTAGEKGEGQGGGDASIKNLIGLWVGLGEAGGGRTCHRAPYV